MSTSGHILLGTIVWAEVREPNGTPVGPHPAMVLNRQEEIDAFRDLRVAVCSTAFGYALPAGWFEIPSQPGGHPLTGLHEACVVKATWLQTIPQSGVIRISGRAPRRVFKQVLNWLKDVNPPRTRPPAM